ncbi:hypothetical protein CAEBREN_07278 [Caenorhabditis brenneri]|uniref:Uncharacterized protein n=1 Tax=Caenorhabditis brenneri TaxID=135651 RepID=G0PJY8_CAEBE|nr:hypothetical protein CAEBREN_07278 [Caenorhabditis brenneri]
MKLRPIANQPTNWVPAPSEVLKCDAIFNVLGAELKEKLEMAGTLDLDGNCRIAKFDSANFTLQR